MSDAIMSAIAGLASQHPETPAGTFSAFEDRMDTFERVGGEEEVLAISRTCYSLNFSPIRS